MNSVAPRSTSSPREASWNGRSSEFPRSFEESRRTGESLLPAVLEGTPPDDGPVVSVTVRGEEVTDQPIPRGLDDGDLLVGVRTEEWTYITNAETGAEELYHRPSDPDQQESRVSAGSPVESEVLKRLRPVARDHADSLTGETTADDDIDEDLETRLSALGYR